MSATIEAVKHETRPASAGAKPSLVGRDRDGLRAALIELGVLDRDLKMRTSQLWHWIYFRGARNFDAMSNVAKEMRERLAARFSLERPEVAIEQVSADGTQKWLIRLPAEHPGEKPYEIETVYIPEAGRGTLCVSSQVGCTLSCTFCHTGTQRLVRNLTAEEIVAQLIIARDRLSEWPEATPPRKSGLPDLRTQYPNSGRPEFGDAIVPSGGRFVTNIVFMGMGEPLYNLDAVKRAVETISDGEGLSVGKRRITVSTSGVVPEIENLGELGAMLAVSLHAASDELRDDLVPLNKKYPIKDLLEACRKYPGLSNARRITFEYVMLKDVNDSEKDAHALVQLLKGIPAKINLIPFNPWPGTKYQCSDWETIERFSEIVFRAGYASPVRRPRGRDILAACGQLKSESQKLSARERLALRAMAMTD
jgi:23S rRNA (adenine2503-C2)-methyltransferase